MNFFTVSLWLCSLGLPVFGKHIEEANSIYPMKTDQGSAFKEFLLEEPVSRHKRNAFVISECVFLTLREDTYFHQATSDSEGLCRFYITTDYDKLVEISFEQLNVSCENDGFVTFVDGWELDGYYFPGVTEHEKPLEDRLHKFCGNVSDQRLVSSQNAAMILYRTSTKTASFSFSVKFLNNENIPCNILMNKELATYMLRTYNDGKAKNCSVISLFPTSVTMYYINVGQMKTPNDSLEETGTIEYCHRKAMSDYILIGNSKTLEPGHIVPHHDFCGWNPQTDGTAKLFGCGVVMVKLISSGQYYNRINFRLSHASDMEVEDSLFQCWL